MKLSKEDIQFIDTYLENSEVVYVDIRMEMVDHVASDIEGRIQVGDTREFSYIFKDYMVENKAQLLEDNKQFLKSADKKIGKALVKEIFSPVTPLIFLASCSMFYVLYQYFSFETFRLFVSFVPLISATGFILTYVIYHNVTNLKRFSVVERLAMPFLAFYQLGNLIFYTSKQVNEVSDLFWLIGGLSLALTLILVLVSISIKLFNSYQRRFKTIT
jgi:hypothetical protein